MKWILFLFITLNLASCSRYISQNYVNPEGHASDGNGSSNDNSNSTSAQAGIWGGPGIQLTITNDGANYELDCAHGSIDEPVKGDSVGHFDLRGKITLEHGGPVTPGEVLPTFDTRYVGSFTATDMLLTMNYLDANSQPVQQSYTLKQGQQGTIHKCL